MNQANWQKNHLMSMERREEIVAEGGQESSHMRYSRRSNSWPGQCREVKRAGGGGRGEEIERVGWARKPNHLLR